MALIKCSECGADISEKAEVCPKCGCPIEVSMEQIQADRKKKVKRLVIVGIMIVLLAIIGAGAFYFANQPDTSGYYKDIPWGVSLEEVKNLLGDEVESEETKDSIAVLEKDYEGKTGVDALIIYDCKDDALESVTLFISNGDNSSYTDQALVDAFSDQLNEQYGEYEPDTISRVWNVKKSRIELSHIVSGYVILEYKDITKADETDDTGESENTEEAEEV